MKKYMSISVLFLVLLLVGCLHNKETSSIISEEENTQGHIKLAELTQPETSLYAINKVDDLYSDLLLEVDGRSKQYPWKNVVNPTYPPRLLYDDLNGDGNEELIIILTLGYGTGALEEEVHIIDPESLKETRVENALQIIDNHVELEVTPENIEVKVSGKKQIIPKTEWETESEKIHSAGFGSIVSYKVENGVLKAYVVGTINLAGFLGELIITYTYQEGTYQASNIKFTSFLMYEND